MIRGNNRKDSNREHLKSWILEGKRESNGKWIEIDKHINEQFGTLSLKVFSVSCNEKLTAVKLSQVDKNAHGDYELVINAFDIFGEYESF